MSLQRPWKKKNIYAVGEGRDKREEKVEISRTVLYSCISLDSIQSSPCIRSLTNSSSTEMEERKISTDPGRMGVSYSLLPEETHLPCSSLCLPYSLCTHPMVALDPESRLLTREGGVEHLPKQTEIEPPIN